MFNDDESLTFKKMQEFSTVDGFVEVGECMAEMIKYVANEPSVGLFYIQHHIRNAVPNVVNLKNTVADKSRDLALHTEDAEDSILMIRSMREYGHSIADEMIKDIESSLDIVSAKQPKRGLISSSSSAFRMGRTSSWGPAIWSGNPSSSRQDGEKSVTYFTNVFRSAKEKASNFKWPQTGSSELRKAKSDAPLSEIVSDQGHTSSVTAAKDSSSMSEAEGDELPLSSPLANEQEDVQLGKIKSHDELFSLAENYSEFRADREAKLEFWLAETRNQNSH